MFDLDRKLSELIARDEGVSPEEVTTDFILQRRKEKVYPNAEFVTRGIYGGYHVRGLRIRTQQEIERNRKRTDAFLSQFASNKDD